MNTQRAYSPFPASFWFPDVDPRVLARDEGTSLDARGMLDGAWTNYLRRVLPPVAEQGTAFLQPKVLSGSVRTSTH